MTETGMTTDTQPPHLTPWQVELYTTWRRLFGLGPEHSGTLADVLPHLPGVHTAKGFAVRWESQRILYELGYLKRVPGQHQMSRLDIRFYATDRPYQEWPRKQACHNDH